MISTQPASAVVPTKAARVSALSDPNLSAYPFLEEFRSSRIPDRLTLANVQWVEGDEAVEILVEHAIDQVQRVDSYITAPAQRILQQYEFAHNGGWNTFGTTINGGMGTVPYFKPKTPRLDFEKHKPIKYETALKMSALPILPFVDPVTAAAIYKRYDIIPIEGETFWQAVKRFNLAVAICEGFKKALSLIAHGIPAIAIRGITQWHKKGSQDLHDLIVEFATLNRKLYIVFDQDEKPRTQRDVRLQATKLGAVLERQGCKVFVLVWDRSIGKGIDDVLYAQDNAAQAWLDTAINTALTIAQYRQGDRLRKALEILERLNVLSYPIERHTEGAYLPKLPLLEPGVIHALSASMNAGKTTRIGEDWTQWAITQGWNVLVLAPLNSLGEQTAQGWHLPHIHTYGNRAVEQQALWADVSHSHGVVMCPDSLHRLPGWFFSRPVLLILDEANQVIEHLTQGDTLKSRWAEILERFTTIAQSAIAQGAIVLSEEGLPDRTVNFVRSISGCDSVRVFTHRKQGEPWRCQMYRGQASGFRVRLLHQAHTAKLLYVTSSQTEAKRLERALSYIAPNRRVVRIDSETNQAGRFRRFFENPDQWLEENQPDVLIVSPTAKSGVSIQGGVAVHHAYFDQVWGYFSSLATDTHMQLLGRFRPSVDRIVFCPDFLLNTGNESLLYPRAIQRRLRHNAITFAGVYGIDELLNVEQERAEQLATIETAVMDYLSRAIAVAGAQKRIAHAALHQRLEAAGHCVTTETLGKDESAIELWKQVQTEIWREDAETLATTEIDPTAHTPEWAHQTLESLEASLETRIRARKVLWRVEFPGVHFDDAEECYEALFKDYGAMHRGVMLQAKSENLESARESERAAVEAVLNGDLRPIHRLPKASIRAALLARTTVLTLTDGSTYHNQDPRAIAVKAEALRFAREIFYWLGLTISDDHTPVEIVNKLLKKLGLQGIPIARPGKRGEDRDRHYQASGLDDPTRSRLLEAVRNRLSGLVSIISEREILSFQTVDTPEKTAHSGASDPLKSGQIVPIQFDSLNSSRSSSQFWDQLEKFA